MIFVIPLLSLLALWFGIPVIARRSEEAALQRRCQNSGAVALTYDDGPGGSLTPALLSLLAAQDVRATFFQIGQNIDMFPAITRRALAEGHEIGSHTQIHLNAWKTWPLAAVRDMMAGVGSVQAAGGTGTLVRPPYGKLTLAGLLSGRRHGLHWGWWTVDSRDSWARRDAGDVLGQISRSGGGVVLMHDFDTPSRQQAGISHHDHVLDLTGRIIALARKEGLRLVTLGELLALPEPAA